MNNYEDTTAILQVIGCCFNSPELLDDSDRYSIHEQDFPNDFHKIVFGSIYNIHLTGSAVTVNTILDYLANRPKYEAIFKVNNGVEYLNKVSVVATADTFNYYYNRLKKMTLLRTYHGIGMDVSDLYDPNNVLDLKKKQKQEDWLDNTSLTDIADLIDKKIDEVRSNCIDNEFADGAQAGDGILDLVAELEERPEVGIPLFGSYINTVTRGARLRKFYLRSGSTGAGKTRAMIADACYFAVDKLYYDDLGWIRNGTAEPTLFIATEQDLKEVQTMMLAFVSNVDEEHILDGRYEEGERERVIEAGKIIQNSPIWVEELPDFSIQDVEGKIKKHIREHDVKYVSFDYIHSSMKILEEVTRRSGGVRLREDNILFILSTKLKDICNQLGVFIESGTQLNGSYTDSETPDQNLLRGAKSIADRVDVGMIMLVPTRQDLEKLEPILAANPNFKTPNIKVSVYKNRRGRYKGIYLWCDANLGTCRINPIFVTNYRHELVTIDDIRVIVEERKSAF